jgi:hypothetical protein
MSTLDEYNPRILCQQEGVEGVQRRCKTNDVKQPRGRRGLAIGHTNVIGARALPCCYDPPYMELHTVGNQISWPYLCQACTVGINVTQPVQSGVSIPLLKIAGQDLRTRLIVGLLALGLQV